MAALMVYGQPMAMHIIAGKHRGRRIEAPEGKEVRPTTARTREAIFNILSHGEYGERGVLQGRVADIFCGSGAMGLEALSRGASHVTFVDKNRISLEAVEFNVERFGEQANCKLLRADSSQLPTVKEAYDLLILDPPYHSGLGTKSLETALKGGWLHEGSVIVLELARKEEIKVPDGIAIDDVRDYGNTHMIFAFKE